MSDNLVIRELADRKSISFSASDKGKQFLVRQETLLFYSEARSLISQPDADLYTDEKLDRLELSSVLAEIFVESCYSMQV